MADVSSERARIRPPDLFEPPGSMLYHYTSLDTALEKILRSGTLKMNPLAMMRDPRESQAWMPTVSGFGSPEDDLQRDTHRFAALLQDMNPGYGEGLRHRIKVLSFTIDDLRVADDSVRTIYDWGFSHSRLWEQYADRHRGVCLCFDRAAFTEYISERLEGEGTLLHEAVAYRNAEIESLFFLAEDVRADDRPSDRQILRHHADFLFTKLADWETEMEYRFAFCTDDVQPLYVSYGHTLKAIVLGYGVDSVYTPAVEQLCDSAHADIYRLSWVNGFPRLAPP